VALSIPKWLWGGSIPFKKHPSVKIKYPQLYLQYQANNASQTISTPTAGSASISSVANTHSGISTNQSSLPGSALGTPIGSFAGAAVLEALVSQRALWNSYIHKGGSVMGFGGANSGGFDTPTSATTAGQMHASQSGDDYGGLVMGTSHHIMETPSGTSTGAATPTAAAGGGGTLRSSVTTAGNVSNRSSLYMQGNSGGLHHPSVSSAGAGRVNDYPRHASNSSATSSGDGQISVGAYGSIVGGQRDSAAGSLTSNTSRVADREERVGGRRREATVNTVFVSNTRDRVRSSNVDDAEVEHYSLQLDALALEM
jgi:hypothetical protein